MPYVVRMLAMRESPVKTCLHKTQLLKYTKCYAEMFIEMGVHNVTV